MSCSVAVDCVDVVWDRMRGVGLEVGRNQIGVGWGLLCLPKECALYHRRVEGPLDALGGHICI